MVAGTASLTMTNISQKEFECNHMMLIKDSDVVPELSGKMIEEMTLFY